MAIPSPATAARPPASSSRLPRSAGPPPASATPRTTVTGPVPARRTAKLTTECRAAVGICDIADLCDGVSDDCPTDLLYPAGTECRAATGVCDPAWFCDGVSPDCYPIVHPGAIVCRDSTGACDPLERCVSYWECPPDIISPPGTVCRGSAGVCDPAEVCNGVNVVCPADAKEPDTTVCRPAAHICDAVEFCDGVSDNCPIIDLPANGLPCPDGNLCNGDEICVGWVCIAGVPPVCDDEDICTADSCDQFLGCVYEPTHCNGHDLPSASPAGRLLLSLLVVGAGATFLAWRRRFGA